VGTLGTIINLVCCWDLEDSMNCVYCNQAIDKESKEHIIHNSIGGLLESTEICCRECNNKIHELIDVEFSKIFAPIISRLPKIKKTNKSGLPSCTGRALYKGKEYPVSIKGFKVSDCLEYKKANRTSLSKDELNDFEIVSYDFNINAPAFKNGISKIAFNFAISSQIPLEYLTDNVQIELESGKLRSVNFLGDIIPFVPLNEFDLGIEYAQIMEFFHTLILFSNGTDLWCYVDLFNTFQYYVHLSNNWCGSEVYETYSQGIEIKEVELPRIISSEESYIHMMSQIYGIEPTYNRDELLSKLSEKIRLASNKRDINEVIIIKENYAMIEKNEDYQRALNFYIDNNDKLEKDRFRKYNFSGYENELSCYPEVIEEYRESLDLFVKEYLEYKLGYINQYLIFNRINAG